MGYPTSITNEVDPISRIEGHLGIAIVNTSGTITNAFAHGNLWRGFENFLLGRDANDAITFVQRICGVCPVPHGQTSTFAVDTVLGYSEGHITFADDGTYGIPPKAVAIRNLVLGIEFIMSSITHFYHLAAPSYIQGPNIPPWTPYFDDSYYANPGSLGAGLDAISMLSGGNVLPGKNADGFSDSVWSTVIRSYVLALRIRRLTFEAGALFAGRMPMTSVLCGGGVTFDGTEDLTARCDMYHAIADEIGHFIIEEYVPIALALSVLYGTYDNVHNTNPLGVTGTGIGGGLGRFLAWGAFPAVNDTTDSASLALVGGYKDLNGGGGNFTVVNKGEVRSKFVTASASTSVPKNLTEDIASSRYAIADADVDAYGAHTYAYPGDVARTKPHRANGYTYMKAPRWNHKSCEVGPMARCFVSGLFVDGTALATSLGGYYTAYVKDLGLLATKANLNPAMISADIAVALLRAGLATVRNATVGTALHAINPAITATTDFTYANLVTYMTQLRSLVGGADNHATIANAYMHGDTIITGAIADHVCGLKAGLSTMDRLRGRAIESLYLIQQILGVYTPTTGTWTGQADRGGWANNGWLAQLKALTGTTLKDTSTSTWKPKTVPAGTVQGWGGTEAPRGALMHQMTITAGKITKYQCIVPTTWNGSPCIGADSDKYNHGAIEAACIGAPFAAVNHSFTIQGVAGSYTATDGVEVMRIAESFDPCIACAIH